MPSSPFSEQPTVAHSPPALAMIARDENSRRRTPAQPDRRGQLNRPRQFDRHAQLDLTRTQHPIGVTAPRAAGVDRARLQPDRRPPGHRRRSRHLAGRAAQRAAAHPACSDPLATAVPSSAARTWHGAAAGSRRRCARDRVSRLRLPSDGPPIRAPSGIRAALSHDLVAFFRRGLIDDGFDVVPAWNVH